MQGELVFHRPLPSGGMHPMHDDKACFGDRQASLLLKAIQHLIAQAVNAYGIFEACGRGIQRQMAIHKRRWDVILFDRFIPRPEQIRLRAAGTRWRNESVKYRINRVVAIFVGRLQYARE